jgi:hypothetical protein
MWFKGPKVLQGRWRKVQGESFRMLVSRIEGVPEVHEERVAFPAKTIFDERIGVSSPVQEVGGHDPDGVWTPQFQLWAVRREVVDLPGNMPKVDSNIMTRNLVAG